MMANLTASTLFQPNVQQMLSQLHSMARSDDREKIQVQIQKAIAAGRDWKASSTEEKAVALKDVLIPIDEEVGKFLYGVVRSSSARRIVEFGTSYGISTIYLAAALRDNGSGLVIGSELESSKVSKATQNLTAAGLADLVEIRAGDALQTLRDLDEPIDLLFLDGWKELYLDVFHLVLPKLRSGAIVIADDVDIFPAELANYLDYVRNSAHGFVSTKLPIDDGMEYSVKL
jgi:predicted O-methyltransferase YrrM